VLKDRPEVDGRDRAILSARRLERAKAKELFEEPLEEEEAEGSFIVESFGSFG